MAEIFFVMFNPHAGWNVGAFYRPFRASPSKTCLQQGLTPYGVKFPRSGFLHE